MKYNCVFTGKDNLKTFSGDLNSLKDVAEFMTDKVGKNYDYRIDYTGGSVYHPLYIKTPTTTENIRMDNKSKLTFLGSNVFCSSAQKFDEFQAVILKEHPTAADRNILHGLLRKYETPGLVERVVSLGLLKDSVVVFNDTYGLFIIDIDTFHSNFHLGSSESLAVDDLAPEIYRYEVNIDNMYTIVKAFVDSSYMDVSLSFYMQGNLESISAKRHNNCDVYLNPGDTVVFREHGIVGVERKNSNSL